MMAIYTLCLAQLKRKKLQNILTILLIMLSTLLMSTSMILLANTDNVFLDMHDRTNGSHELLLLDQGIHPPADVQHWWSEQAGVSTTPLLPYQTISKVSKNGNVISNVFVYLMDTPNAPMTVDRLLVAHGEESIQPAPGTIWLPSSLANKQGIEVGDRLEFESGGRAFELSVSAIVIDLPYGAPFSTSSRIWMNPADFKSQLTSVASDSYMLGLRYDASVDRAALWEQFEASLNSPYIETKLTYEEMSSFYLILNKLIGYLMIALGATMLVIALLTIGFTVSDAILTQYRSIGIIKSLGMTSNRTLAVFLMQYILLTVAAVIPGLALSGLISGFIMDGTLSNLRLGQADAPSFQGGAMLSIGLLVLVLVSACTYAVANKTRRIMPAQAIRYGMSEDDNARFSKRQAGWIRLDRFSPSIVLAWKNIRSHQKGSWLIFIISCVTAAALSFGYTLVNSVASIDQRAGEWGYDSSHIAAIAINPASFSRDALDKALEQDSRVRSSAWLSTVNGVVISDSPININISVLEGSFEETGLTTIQGHNPQLRNEIALGVNVARQLDVGIGEHAEVYIQGVKRTFVVSGIYQAIANMSYSARISSEAILDGKGVSSFKPDTAFINVFDLEQADSVAAEFNERFRSSMTIVTQKQLLDSVFKEATGLLILPMGFIALLFIAVSAIIIYSTCKIQIRKESKTYGIYKTIGLTSSRIRVSILSGIAGIAFAGALVGVLTGIFVLPSSIESLLHSYGILYLPIVLDWTGIAIAACLSIIPAALGSWLSSSLIASTSPRNLIVD
ncbi:FtsX-like permease family protein [Paenibacillus sp. 1011MAR3C5]|uniref:FtsX-like permease family protein n=1 Tax=Paenibacillus sp. 1011MAR3C5 TaxID=1675787 RepID=UPI001600E614|nr:FtsX-like permease family protein [Paenibacillus sp. 1011MAR3C5]